MASSSLEELKNLGPATCGWLHAAGIDSAEALARIGAVEAWWRLQEAGFGPSRIALWALQGALLDIDWREIPAAMKSSLLAELEARGRGV